ncbi:ATP10 protein [Reichenbachiella faecimaris]|uniref:ATP10 protein n=1 Tax=Reichenbachiella faecimaris TaxID=692418 RepID=A0A1W2G7K4_REIFA|nr:hypothetical protein [Reichenbachiella faecimaris]SMD32613.1 ATP10 protein [Reichenbachiella faecimaris]
MKNLLAILLILTTGAASAQMGDIFPDMEGESLRYDTVNIPSDLKGKYSLIALAFSKKSEKDLGSWFNPMYNQFLVEPDPNALFSFEYDMELYIIPMFTGAKRAAYKSTMKKVQETVAPELQHLVLFYKGTLRQYKQALNFDGNDVPYFYVLDTEGKIIYHTSGKYTRNKMQEIIDALEPAAK